MIPISVCDCEAESGESTQIVIAPDMNFEVCSSTTRKPYLMLSPGSCDICTACHCSGFEADVPRGSVRSRAIQQLLADSRYDFVIGLSS